MCWLNSLPEEVLSHRFLLECIIGRHSHDPTSYFSHIDCLLHAPQLSDLGHEVPVGHDELEEHEFDEADGEILGSVNCEQHLVRLALHVTSFDEILLDVVLVGDRKAYPEQNEQNMEYKGAQFSTQSSVFDPCAKHLDQSDNEDGQNSEALRDQANRADRECRARSVLFAFMLLLPENPVDLKSYLLRDHDHSIHEQSYFVVAHAMLSRLRVLAAHTVSLIDLTEA